MRTTVPTFHRREEGEELVAIYELPLPLPLLLLLATAIRSVKWVCHSMLELCVWRYVRWVNDDVCGGKELGREGIPALLLVTPRACEGA